MNQPMNHTTNQSIRESVNEWLNEGVKQRMNQRINQWREKSINESMVEWINESNPDAPCMEYLTTFGTLLGVNVGKYSIHGASGKDWINEPLI